MQKELMFKNRNTKKQKQNATKYIMKYLLALVVRICNVLRKSNAELVIDTILIIQTPQ